MMLKLNYLKTNEIYQQTRILARTYCPEWINDWPENLDTNVDPGLALLRLFSDLSEYVIKKINYIPDQRFLSYLSFMGLSLGNPLPAKTLLSFIPKDQATDTLVTINTAIASQLNPKLFFYTQQDLQVLPFAIDIALFINPDQDAFLDQSQNVSNDKSSFIIFDNQDSQPLNHLLLLGDDVLFTPSPALQNLKITFSGSNLYIDYFTQWFDDVGNPINITWQENDEHDGLTIIFSDITSLQTSDTLAMPVSQVLSNLLANTAYIGEEITSDPSSAVTSYFWLAVKPAQGVKIFKNYQNILPQISTITCETSGVNIAPEVTLYNNLLLSTKNGFYPFGQMPQLQDAFYIGSSDVFNRTGANITLQFSIDPAVASSDSTQPLTATLAWEYWDGQGWQDLLSYIIANDTDNFIDSSSAPQNPTKCFINFICPAMQSLLIAGQENFWVRSRIASGNYSVLNTKTTETEYCPPFIYSLNIDYNFITSNIKQCLTHNNFTTSNLINQPYIPVTDPFPAFYLGLETQFMISNLVNKNLTLLFAIEQSAELSSNFNFKPEKSPIQWQYYDGLMWQNLNVTDNTLGLSVPGVVSFQIPSTWQQSVLFGQNLFWLRIENQSNVSPSTYGIYPNSVFAVNATTITNETLGSSSGDPSQKFILANKNILAGQSIAVIENKLINQEEIDQLEAELGTTAVTEVEINGTEYVQVIWQEVDNFAFSTPTSRHYVLNHQAGKLTFGDGQQGMVPPTGTHNVIALMYQTSLGTAGNSDLNTLTQLQITNGQIQAVTNHVAAEGGSDGYALETVKQQGPHYLKSFGRAVIEDDYSALAVQASPLILRAATQTQACGNIQIYVLADMDTPKPLASYELLKTIKRYVSQYVYLPLQDRIDICSPNYLAVNVVVQCYAAPNVSSAEIATAIQTQLSQFLDPRHGGSKANGWDFGESLNVTQLVGLVQRIVGVTNIVSITANGNTNQVTLTPDQLICCGIITPYVF